MRLENPKIELKIYGEDELVINEAYVEFTIEKNLTHHPNECELQIWNLNENHVNKIKSAAELDAPIEVFFARGGIAGANELELAYSGEIDSTYYEAMHPGNMTTVKCTSQKINHRDFFIKGTFAKGTAISKIMTQLIDKINLPAGNDYDLPDGDISQSESFEGPAFNILQRYCHDLGRIAYIADGKLYISSIYEPPRLEALVITDDIIISKPESRTFENKNLIEKKAIAENHIRHPFKDKGKRRRRKKKKKKILGKNYHIEYNAVDLTVFGIAVTIYASVKVQADDIIKINESIYRIINLTHEADNEGGDCVTEIEAEDYNHYLLYAPRLEELKV